jgi:hypothetical protein
MRIYVASFVWKHDQNMVDSPESIVALYFVYILQLLTDSETYIDFE